MEVHSNTTDTPTLKMVTVNSSKTYYYAPYQINCFHKKNDILKGAQNCFREREWKNNWKSDS